MIGGEWPQAYSPPTFTRRSPASSPMRRGSRGFLGCPPYQLAADPFAVPGLLWPALLPARWLFEGTGPLPYPFQEVGVSLDRRFDRQLVSLDRLKSSWFSGVVSSGDYCQLDVSWAYIGPLGQVIYFVKLFVGGVLTSTVPAALVGPTDNSRVGIWGAIASLRPPPYISPPPLRPCGWLE